ncbi:DgyrCDS10152 [Dimorphilus gyrociliatus]|uniref:DgyrCDS10152 n=1 Tax=Dimorphilus gyrociliatus TaxID=2664684 RepID=A0A7I8W0R6_9ANNE|nr:DgyrCDS10152 [Dimorphilus gyrociliatus]
MLKSERTIKMEDNGQNSSRKSHFYLNLIYKRLQEFGELLKRNRTEEKISIYKLKKKVEKILKNRFNSYNKVHEYVQNELKAIEQKDIKSLTFGQFSYILSELEEGITKISNASIISDKKQNEDLKAIKKMEKFVFLGGSCGITTWRNDVIKNLEKNKINYYNPLKSDWTIECMEEECKAKESAFVNFFAIKNNSRGIASIYESAYLLGKRKNVILVLEDMKNGANEHRIDNQCLKDTEYEELKQARRYLAYLYERQGYPVYKNENQAILHLESIIEEYPELFDRSTKKRIQLSNDNIIDKLEKLTDSITAIIEEKKLLNFTDLEEFYDNYYNCNLPFWARNNLESFKCSTVDECLCFLSEFRSYNKQKLIRMLKGELTLTKTDERDNYRIFYDLKRKQMKKMNIKRNLSFSYKIGSFPLIKEDFSFLNDIYCIGSSLGYSKKINYLLNQFKNDMVMGNQKIKMFKNHSWSNDRYNRKEEAEKLRSKVLFFLFGEDCRGILTGVEAAFFIGIGKFVIVHSESFKIDNKDKISEREFKDYNNARKYLMEMFSNQRFFNEPNEVITNYINKKSKTVQDSLTLLLNLQKMGIFSKHTDNITKENLRETISKDNKEKLIGCLQKRG